MKEIPHIPGRVMEVVSMKLVRILMPLALLATCGFAQDTRYNFDKGANFSAYKTFKWVQIPNAAQLDQLVDQQVKKAFESELAAKGLSKTEGESADLLVGYQVSIGKEQQINSYSSDFGYGGGWGRGYYRGGGMGSTTTTSQTSTIHIGQVVFDMYDPAKKQLVWRGIASKTLDEKAKPDKREKNLQKGVTKLLKNYPPPPPKS
jgi:hypothetical protein